MLTSLHPPSTSGDLRRDVASVSGSNRLTNIHTHTLVHLYQPFPVSIVVSIPACHAGDRGSIPRRGGTFFSLMRPPAAVFETYAILFTLHCFCLSEETLKAGGPFYLVSIPGEVKDPTQGVNV